MQIQNPKSKIQNKKNLSLITYHLSPSSGFTLIELLVAIAIIAMLIGLALPNFLGARQRARDSKKKSEAAELKNALRLYYNDYQKYPANYTGGGFTNYIAGCGPNGTANCPCDSSVDFASGSTCQIVYMKKLPADLGLTMYYYQVAGGEDFCVKVPLDNPSDADMAPSQARCASSCTGYYTATDYVVCAD